MDTFPEYNGLSIADIISIPTLSNQLFHSIEGFAGAQSLTKAMRSKGLKALATDRKYNKKLAIHGPTGLKFHSKALRLLRRGGLQWHGVECTT